ncbi:MAG TPA: hypothetical protein VEV44_04885 [Pseudoneobacillus sp.]|nr:hypothetical protein [Pseudoneobacillus sp.]
MWHACHLLIEKNPANQFGHSLVGPVWINGAKAGQTFRGSRLTCYPNCEWK